MAAESPNDKDPKKNSGSDPVPLLEIIQGAGGAEQIFRVVPDPKRAKEVQERDVSDEVADAGERVEGARDQLKQTGYDDEVIDALRQHELTEAQAIMDAVKRHPSNHPKPTPGKPETT